MSGSFIPPQDPTEASLLCLFYVGEKVCQRVES